MTPDQWRLARDLFERAVDLAPADAAALLTREPIDAAVLAEVRSLLDHHARAGAFLSGSMADQIAEVPCDAARFGPGDAIGPYTIQREIGRGGMGRVYLATDTRLARDVALKVLPTEFVREPAQRERLRREARAAAALSHPGICTVFALEEIGDEVVIASEYVDGHTLRDEIEQPVRPSGDQVLHTARELAAALAAAHARGITHRDLKPENVMRSAGGALKILDFGLAIVDRPEVAAGNPRVTTPGAVVGTPAYMAPEQLTGGVVDPRTDVFALGVLLYEYATGRHPFEAVQPLAMVARIIEGEPVPLTSVRPDLPPQIASVIERCVRKRPAQRFASAADVVAALGSPARAVPAGASRAWWRVHVAAAMALYAVSVLAAWMAKEWDHGMADPAFVLVATAATVGAILRGHLLFADRNHDAAVLRAELRRTTPVVIAADLLIAVILVAEGLSIARSRSVPGVLILALGISVALARLVLERSTTSAAFGDTHHPDAGA